MYKTSLLALTLAAALPAQAVTITQWNFNGQNLTASTGQGTAKLVGTAKTVNVTTTGFSGLSSDKAWQTNTYPAVSVDNKTSGAQFDVSTKGHEKLNISFDLRPSNTGSRYGSFQYSIDGSNYIDLSTFDANSGGDKWYSRAFDLSQIAGVSDNDKFSFRVVSIFEPGKTAYKAATSTSTYAATGTWRFDNVTISGSTVTPVPEPETYALMLAGLLAVGGMARRRRQD